MYLSIGGKYLGVSLFMLSFIEATIPGKSFQENRALRFLARQLSTDYGVYVFHGNKNGLRLYILCFLYYVMSCLRNGDCLNFILVDKIFYVTYFFQNELNAFRKR